MSPKVDAKRICEVLRLIDQGLGYSDSVAEFERKWCINMWLAEEIEVDNTPLIRLTDLGMGMFDHWSRIYGDKEDKKGK